MSDTAAIAITTVFLVLIILVIVGNSLVCAIIKRNRDLRTPMNYLLVNLAVADILYAAFMVPDVLYTLTFSHPGGVTGTVLCKLLTGGNIAWVGAACSIVTLAAIAIERYYAVMYPLGNRGKLTKRGLKVVITVSWIFSLILNMPTFVVDDFDSESESCYSFWPEEWMEKAHILLWEVLAVIIILLMIVLYSKVVFALWFKRNEENQLTHQQMGVVRVRKRATLMVVTVSVMFGICWGTDVVVYLLKDLSSYNIGPVPVVIANTMVLFNSAVNPFVYALLNKQFREKMKRMICCAGYPAIIVHPVQEPQAEQLDENTTHL